MTGTPFIPIILTDWNRLVVKHFRENGLKFPAHVRSGPHAGEIVWKPLLRCRYCITCHIFVQLDLNDQPHPCNYDEYS
jgi:hypothetical protein